VLKKEHLGLNEVGKMLRGINEEKRDYDRARGKRIHDFCPATGQQNHGV
jgi:hypothetical protein